MRTKRNGEKRLSFGTLVCFLLRIYRLAKQGVSVEMIRIVHNVNSRPPVHKNGDFTQPGITNLFDLTELVHPLNGGSTKKRTYARHGKQS